jgi:acetyltransferase
MSIRDLNYLFQPSSIAVVGASNRPGRVGAVLMRNLLAGGFQGPILPVNPNYASVAGVLAYPSVEALPLAPDLAVIATPPATVPGQIAALGARGTRAAVVISAGAARSGAVEAADWRRALLEATCPGGMRILGPNCLGLIVPGIGLNASFAHLGASPGTVAFVSQSGALCTAVLDWAQSRAIGFSHFISMGDMADVDFADVLDHLSLDPGTRSILLYIESIRGARKFLSAARAAAKAKTVLAIKAGRAPEGARAAASHTGALSGTDEVYDAAIERAGVLRVYSIDEIFEAVETLSRAAAPTTRRLTIVTNGGGPGVIATDALIAGGGELAELAEGTLSRLDALLPGNWPRANPVDLIGDAGPERYRAAVEALLADDGADALLILHVPTAISSGLDSARAVTAALEGRDRTALTCWMGDSTAREARALFARAGIPTYETPESAIRAYLHLVNYRRNQELLMEVPPSAPEGFEPRREPVRAAIDGVLAEGRSMLTEAEAKIVLAAYGIPTVETRVASTPEAAAAEAEALGFPVALKLLSRDVSHKSDVGGVALDLEGRDEVLRAAETMASRASRLAPAARLDGFTVQRMARWPGAHELIVGMASDPAFGPVLLFGHGGTAVEAIADRALALPPLNAKLARQMMERTRVFRLLRGYRRHPPADLDAVVATLIKVSQLVTDFAEIAELDINPLFAAERGVLALDARIVVVPNAATASERLAIRPYPGELEEVAALKDGSRIVLRPIRPEDERAHHELLERSRPEDIRFRFFGLLRSLPHAEMARFTQIDYDREMAFIAVSTGAERAGETLGVVRAVNHPAGETAEFAILVRSDFKGRGLGRLLMEKIVAYLRSRGIREVVGQTMSDNSAMLALARKLGFKTRQTADGFIELRLALAPRGREAP